MAEKEAGELLLAGRKQPTYWMKLEGKTWIACASQCGEHDGPSVCAIGQQRSFHQEEQ